MAFERLFDKAMPTKSWMDDSVTKLFAADLAEWRKDFEKTKQSSKDLVDIARAQGAVTVINRILGLREELNELLNPLKKGA